jgi:hypothetical protein
MWLILKEDINYPLVIARVMTRSNPQHHDEIASLQDAHLHCAHTCPGGRCQGAQVSQSSDCPPRNDRKNNYAP